MRAHCPLLDGYTLHIKDGRTEAVCFDARPPRIDLDYCAIEARMLSHAIHDSVTLPPDVTHRELLDLSNLANRRVMRTLSFAKCFPFILDHPRYV